MKRFLYVVCIVGVLLVAVSCAKREKAAPGAGRALDFALEDTGGKKVTLSALKGKVVLVEFWATWCPPCRDSIPEMNKLYEKFKNRDFELLAVAMDEGSGARSEVGSFVKENGIAYHVLLDDGKTSSAFGVSNIPVIFILDKQGKPLKKQVGFMPELTENLSKDIEGLL